MNINEEILKSLTDFFVMTGAGFFLGFVFDVFRAMRGAVKKNNGRMPDAAVIFQDMVFLLFTFSVIVLLMYSLNGGIIKAYLAAGAVIGFVVYYIIGAPVAGKIVFWVFFAVFKIIKIIGNFLKKIFKFLQKVLAKK